MSIGGFFFVSSLSSRTLGNCGIMEGLGEGCALLLREALAVSQTISNVKLTLTRFRCIPEQDQTDMIPRREASTSGL